MACAGGHELESSNRESACGGSRWGNARESDPASLAGKLEVDPTRHLLPARESRRGACKPSNTAAERSRSRCRNISGRIFQRVRNVPFSLGTQEHA